MTTEADPVRSAAADPGRRGGGSLGRSSVMRLEDGAPRIEGGEVRFSVPHRQPGHPFVVRAEGYRVVVVGTRFGVSVDGKSEAKPRPTTKKRSTSSDEGIVEVWDAATQRRLARLTPGESWRSPESPRRPPPARPRSSRRPHQVVPAPVIRRNRPRRATSTRRQAASARTLALASPASSHRTAAGAAGPRSPNLRQPARRWPPETRPARCSSIARWRRGRDRRPRTPPTRSGRS